MEILRVEHCSKTYGYRGNLTHALKDISFSVSEGEFVGIMGASGSGKTTLLNCISTVDKPTEGRVFLGGEDLTSLNRKATANFRREKLGFVFQDFNLLDTLTCGENIALALSIQHYPGKKVEEKVQEAARGLGVEKILDKFPYEVSGGEKQRIACARAMVTNPLILLADEPTGALDSRSSRILMETFQDLNRRHNTAILMVTHDANMASYCSRVLFIKDGEIFNEIYRGDDTQRSFYERILDVTGFLGGKIHETQSGFTEC